MSRRILTGIVISDVCDKTVLVRVERRGQHPLYGKIVRKFKKYMVHDPLNTFKVSDVVAIRESRPYSRRKRWEVLSSSHVKGSGDES